VGKIVLTTAAISTHRGPGAEAPSPRAQHRAGHFPGGASRLRGKRRSCFAELPQTQMAKSSRHPDGVASAGAFPGRGPEFPVRSQLRGDQDEAVDRSDQSTSDSQSEN
jgi:hypothetical protein